MDDAVNPELVQIGVVKLPGLLLWLCDPLSGEEPSLRRRNHVAFGLRRVVVLQRIDSPVSVIASAAATSLVARGWDGDHLRSHLPEVRLPRDLSGAFGSIQRN